MILLQIGDGRLQWCCAWSLRPEQESEALSKLRLHGFGGPRALQHEGLHLLRLSILLPILSAFLLAQGALLMPCCHAASR